MLNPLEQDHQQLYALMEGAVDQLRSTVRSDIENNIEAISRETVRASQAILKREWVRVKRGE